MYHASYKAHQDVTDHWTCASEMDPKFEQLYMTALEVLVTYIPLIVISITQFFAYKSLKRSTELFGKSDKRMRIMKQVFNTFIIVIVVFFLLTTPVSFLILFYYWYHDKKYLEAHLNLIDDIFGVLNLFVSMNSCVNPLIYGGVNDRVARFFNSRFRKRRLFNASFRKRGNATYRKGSRETTELTDFNQCDYSFPSYSVIKTSFRPSISIASDEICLQSMKMVKRSKVKEEPKKKGKTKTRQKQDDMYPELNPN